MEGIVRQRLTVPAVGLEPRGGILGLVTTGRIRVSAGLTYAFAAPGVGARLSLELLPGTLVLVLDGDVGRAAPGSVSRAAQIVHWSFHSQPLIHPGYSYGRLRAGLELTLRAGLALLLVVESTRLRGRESGLPSALVAAAGNHYLDQAALRGVSLAGVGLTFAL